MSLNPTEKSLQRRYHVSGEPWPLSQAGTGEGKALPVLMPRTCDLLCPVLWVFVLHQEGGVAASLMQMWGDEGREGPISSPSIASQGTGLARLGECSWSSLSPISRTWRRSCEYPDGIPPALLLLQNWAEWDPEQVGHAQHSILSSSRLGNNTLGDPTALELAQRFPPQLRVLW